MCVGIANSMWRVSADIPFSERSNASEHAVGPPQVKHARRACARESRRAPTILTARGIKLVKLLRPGLANRTQAMVLGFLLVAWLSLVAILLAAPDVYNQTLKLPASSRHAGELGFLVAISAFLILLGMGVVRRWRWTFWLILVAFLFGVLRVPASALELAGLLPTTGPTWYVAFQAIIGIVQFAIGVAMLAGYRRAGIWGSGRLH